MITVTFKCGHTHVLTGDESVPVCHCGERHLMNVKAPAPRFSGWVAGPTAKFEELPAQPVTLKDKTS